MIRSHLPDIPMNSLHKILRCTLALSGIVLLIPWLRHSTAVSANVDRASITTGMSKSKRPMAHLPSSVITLSVAREAALLNSPGHTAADDLATLDLMLSCYRLHNDGNPVGANEQITATLRGHNPKHLAYLPQEGSFVDGNGRLIDRWGTPYFFHALAGDHMDIRSAGPDRVLWTKDDLVHHPGD